MQPRHWYSGADRHSPRKSGSGSWCHCPVFEAWLMSCLFAPLPLCSLLSRSAVALRGGWKCMRLMEQSRHSVQNDDRMAPKFQSYVPPTHTLTLPTSTSLCLTWAHAPHLALGVVVLDRKQTKQQYLPADLVCLCVLLIFIVRLQTVCQASAYGSFHRHDLLLILSVCTGCCHLGCLM